MGQIIVRVIASLVSVATAFVMNVSPSINVEGRDVFEGSASSSSRSSLRSAKNNAIKSADNGNGNSAEDNRLNGFADGDANNPDFKLPSKVASSFKNSDEVVSSKYALTSTGHLKSLKTGDIVTDPKIIGTKDKQPDPLAKSDGRRFTPITVGDLRKAIKRYNPTNSTNSANAANPSKVRLISSNQPIPDESKSSAKAKDSTILSSKTATTTDGIVRKAYLPVTNYGVEWEDYNGSQSFFDGNGNMFAYNARGVIDVSEHQHEIDWAAAKAAGVEGAIIRISYGWDNGYDKYAVRNINECKRLGIPFGVYVYSYAETPSDGASEGADVARLLQGAGVNPSDLSYPVYYDLERWEWAGHQPPTDPYVYQNIVASWWNQLASAGYTNLGVYSYANYLNGPLNSQYIHDRTSWVASYGASTLFNITTPLGGWQYTSSGSVSGIQGNVDLNAFGTRPTTPTSRAHIDFTWIVRSNDIAVGAAASSSIYNHMEYRWLAYDLLNKQWKTISDWSVSNWASWVTSNGDYWLHCDVRDSFTKKPLGNKTIAFHYEIQNAPAPVFTGDTVISGTYAAWRGSNVLLGATTNNPNGYTIIKIYDYNAKQWVSQFKGPWALWSPKPGIYWTHFEAYTSNGTLKDTKTYAFGV